MNMQKLQIIKLNQKSLPSGLMAWIVFLVSFSNTALAVNKAITDLNFSSLSGNKVQIEMGFDGQAGMPKVFQTDNPARIALDFPKTKSQLKTKLYKINQGAVGSVYVAETQEKTRVIVSLSEKVPYETRVQGNKAYLTLIPANMSANKPVDKKRSATMKKAPVISRQDSASLLPKQTINNIDFRRGAKGEGRILIDLSAPNTVVDIKERAGKVELNFLNTQLPREFAKNYDVSDFATPVQSINAKRKGNGVALTVVPVDGNFDYSSFQSDGVLAIDFIPLTEMEKEAMLKKKFPYTGKKLTFNFQDIEVRSVLQILADFTELNIVAADSVGGNVTLRLNDVPWDQALDLILKSKGLAKRKTGNVVLVAPAAEIIKIEKEELDAMQVVEQLEPLRTEYIQINYAKAEDIQRLLVGSNVVKSLTQMTASRSTYGPGQSGSGGGFAGGGGGAGAGNIFGGANNTSNRSRGSNMGEMHGVLSDRGSSTVDGRTNTIIVRDTVKQLEEIREMIRILDVPIRQVMIEARIVIADNNFAQEIGVKFGVAKAAAIGSDKVFAMGAGQNQTFGELNADATGSNVTVPDGAGYLVDLGASAINNHPVGALGMTLARAADYVLNLELSALENENRGEVLANPRVMTSDRELAFIKQGVQIPYTTVSQDGTQTQLIDAVLELNVTPQITPDGDVIMDLLIKKDAANQAGGIDKREVETLVRVKDGETIILGGVYEGDQVKEVFKIPFFGDLPGIGNLFKKNIENERKRELLVFVTPKIVKNTLSAR